MRLKGRCLCKALVPIVLLVLRDYFLLNKLDVAWRRGKFLVFVEQLEGIFLV